MSDSLCHWLRLERATFSHPRLSPFLVVDAICRIYEIGTTQLLGRSHAEPERTARMLAMVLVHRLHHLSSQETGDLFGRDPSNVSHALRRVASLYRTSRSDRALMDRVLQILALSSVILAPLDGTQSPEASTTRLHSVRVHLENLPGSDAAMVSTLVDTLVDEDDHTTRERMRRGEIGLIWDGQKAHWTPMPSPSTTLTPQTQPTTP